MKLKHDGYNLVFLSIDRWGSMKVDFEENFETYYCNIDNNSKKGIKSIFSKTESPLENIKKKYKIDFIYANTIACMHLLPILKTKFNCKIISHIHELQFSIKQFGNKDALKNLFAFSDKIIACSNAVATNLKEFQNSTNIEVIHSFVDNSKILERIKNSDIKATRRKYYLENYFLAGACGNADWRKATDIFVKIASHLKEDDDIKFVWIGIDKNSEFYFQVKYDAEKLGVDQNIIWIEPTTEAVEIINCLDLFVVCSREDPFPLVMLEAALCCKPILGFKNTGGTDEFIESDAGLLSNYLDDVEMAKNIYKLYSETEIRFNFGQNAKNKVLNKYNFDNSFEKIIYLFNKIQKVN
jgi:glycosyltransferase involved in cell wall biosynthesis